jgi:hypothetical protein
MLEMNRRAILTAMAGILAGGELLQASELGSALLNSGQGKLEAGPAGDLRVYFEGPTAGLKNLVVEEIMVVTEGTGEIIMNGKASAVGPGAVMYTAPNYLHGVRNTGAIPLVFYYFKWIAKTS